MFVITKTNTNQNKAIMYQEFYKDRSYRKTKHIEGVNNITTMRMRKLFLLENILSAIDDFSSFTEYIKTTKGDEKILGSIYGWEDNDHLLCEVNSQIEKCKKLIEKGNEKHKLHVLADIQLKGSLSIYANCNPNSEKTK